MNKALLNDLEEIVQKHVPAPQYFSNPYEVNEELMEFVYTLSYFAVRTLAKSAAIGVDPEKVEDFAENLKKDILNAYREESQIFQRAWIESLLEDALNRMRN